MLTKTCSKFHQNHKRIKLMYIGLINWMKLYMVTGIHFNITKYLWSTSGVRVGWGVEGCLVVRVQAQEVGCGHNVSVAATIKLSMTHTFSIISLLNSPFPIIYSLSSSSSSSSIILYIIFNFLLSSFHPSQCLFPFTIYLIQSTVIYSHTHSIV